MASHVLGAGFSAFTFTSGKAVGVLIEPVLEPDGGGSNDSGGGALSLADAMAGEFAEDEMGIGGSAGIPGADGGAGWTVIVFVLLSAVAVGRAGVSGNAEATGATVFAAFCSVDSGAGGRSANGAFEDDFVSFGSGVGMIGVLSGIAFGGGVMEVTIGRSGNPFALVDDAFATLPGAGNGGNGGGMSEGDWA